MTKDNREVQWEDHDVQVKNILSIDRREFPRFPHDKMRFSISLNQWWNSSTRTIFQITNEEILFEKDYLNQCLNLLIFFKIRLQSLTKIFFFESRSIIIIRGHHWVVSYEEKAINMYYWSMRMTNKNLFISSSSFDYQIANNWSASLTCYASLYLQVFFHFNSRIDKWILQCIDELGIDVREFFFFFCQMIFLSKRHWNFF